MKKLLLLNVFFLSLLAAFGQVTKSDATGQTLNAQIATRNLVFTAGDFPGCTSLTEVEVDLTLTLTNLSNCNPGGYGVHNDIAVSLTSPSGTTVHLVHDFTGILLGFPPPLITYNDAGYPTIVNQTATYDDDAALLADDQTFFGTGTWKPQNPLSAFDGENPVGTWVLRVADGRDQFGGADFTCYINSAVRITCGAPCTNPTVPTITSAPTTVCPGGSPTLTISGTLNDATQWAVYTGSCGGTLVGTTTTSTFVAPAISSNTTYFVRGEGGCVSPGACGSVTVNVSTLNMTAASQTNVSCFGGSNGAASVNAATGGAGGYTYNWTPGNPVGDGTTSVSGLSAGSWTCTVTDANSCTKAVTFTVTQPSAITLNPASQTNVSCFGGSNGAATVNAATGGAGGYTYNWTPGNPVGDGTTSVSGLTAGTWTCTVTDANSCTRTQTFTITQPSAITVTPVSQTNVSCFGGSNGAAAINTPTGGAGGYTYNWTPGNPVGDGTTSVSGLTAGTWTCTVTDANTCTMAVTFTVTQPSAITLNPASQTNVSCFGGSNGAATVNAATGGAGGYTYNWTPGNPTGDGTTSVSGLTAGTWTCTVTDANSCTKAVTFTVTQPSAIVVTQLSSTNPTCSGSNGAAAINTPTGGAGGYTYNWTPGNPTGDGTTSVTGLTAGSWTCTVTDANACTSTSVFTLVNSGTLDDASFSYSASTYCSNDLDPTPTITGLAGGTFTSTAGLALNPGSGLIDVSASTPGTYTVTYTTSGSCPNSSAVSVTVSTLDNASFSYSASSYCPNGSDPTPTITGSLGGTFTSAAGLSLNPSTGLIDLSATTPGAYTVTYVTAGTCPNSSAVTVTVSDVVPPVITCPGNQLEVASATCDFVLPDYTGLASATDNCSGAPAVTQSPVPGTVITANTTITLTANDGNGNTSTCTFNVTLDFSACVGTECINAIALAPMNPCGDMQAVTGSTVGGTTSTETSFCGTSAGSGGANWYTFTGDGSEWTASTVNAGTNYDTKLWVYQGVCGALNCITGNDDYSGVQSQVSFVTVAGATYYVVVGGYSTSEGNYTATFSNVELEAPVADVTPLADINGVCEITSLTAPTATDNCTAVTVTNNATLPITTSSTITWTYTDANGNSSTQTQNVVLVDAIAPTASNPDTMYYECIGDAVIDVAVVNDEADNCVGAITVSHVSDVVSGNGCQDTITRTYNVADGSGNNIDVTQIIIIEDITAPTASNPITLNVQCSADVPAPTAGWVTDEADNCTSSPVVAFVSDVSDGLSCPETITRTFSVTDNCGNSITVEQLIVINDIEAPTLNATTLAPVTGFCDVSPTPPTASDNCAGTITGVSDVTLPINTLGTTTITWTFTDACGNSVSQTQNVTVNSINVTTWMASDGITIVSNNLASGVTYQWIDCDSNIQLAGETNHNFTPTYSSDFAVIITQDGCADTSACVTITEVSVDQLTMESFTMYPNPTTSGVFTIAVDAALKEVSVVDMLGRTVLVNVDLNTKTIDGSNLVNGAYIVRIVTVNDQEMIGTVRVQ